jgi:hypothetical protein
MLQVLGVIVVLGAGASPAAAQVNLDFQNGNVRLKAQGVPVSQILAEWGRRGRTTIVNGERVPGPAVTIELQDVPEQTALDVLLRGVSGYLVAQRETAVSGASAFDRIYILPTSARPTNAAPLPPQQQALQQVQDDFDDELPPGPRGIPNPANPANPGNPGARLPREIAPGVTARPGAPIEQDQEPDLPENRPAPATPSNPFGVTPGATPTRPGTISPGPATTRDRQQQ